MSVKYLYVFYTVNLIVFNLFQKNVVLPSIFSSVMSAGVVLLYVFL